VFIQTQIHGPIWIEAGERFAVPFDPEELAVDDPAPQKAMEARA
jgi:hypothetical protein